MILIDTPWCPQATLALLLSKKLKLLTTGTLTSVSDSQRPLEALALQVTFTEPCLTWWFFTGNSRMVVVPPPSNSMSLSPSVTREYSNGLIFFRPFTFSFRIFWTWTSFWKISGQFVQFRPPLRAHHMFCLFSIDKELQLRLDIHPGKMALNLQPLPAPQLQGDSCDLWRYGGRLWQQSQLYSLLEFLSLLFSYLCITNILTVWPQGTQNENCCCQQNSGLAKAPVHGEETALCPELI